MNKALQIDVLNCLLAIHYRSLPMYLASARPWFPVGEECAAELLLHIAADHRHYVDRISDRLIELGAEGADIDRGHFPTSFTDLHDLSLTYLLPLVIEHQRRDIAAIEDCAKRVPDETLAQEASGAAKAHLEALEEVSGNRTAKIPA
ncbi:MAG: hypothetical protein WD176_04550 [Pirellulales bacterium]